MAPDTILLLGLVPLWLCIPAMLADYAERQFPWIGLVLLFLGAVICGYAYMRKPGGYALEDVPEALLQGLANIF